MRRASFGRWVREARNALDLTQEALAERTGCAVQTIRKIEAGERRPSQQMARRLAEALALPLEEQPLFIKAARADVAQPADAPAAQSPATPSRRAPVLPAIYTRFVGRAAEVSEVRRLLADPDYRLVTLVGPGGIGKTRLALEAVAGCCPFTDGVIFVPLAPISTDALLAPTIADAVGYTFAGLESPVIQLLRYLKSKALLLILDNLEHLLGDTAGGERMPSEGIGGTAQLLAQILLVAPGIKLLVTSRERVNLQGEWVVQLEGLPVGQGDAPDDPRVADAVVLFAERARQVQHDFHLSASNRADVMRICGLLEGMPLGIELAATWARVLSPTEIVTELERGLDFLEASTRDLPTRHRSMRAVFEHSWQLLAAEEQQVLRRLTVFRGGFTRAAAAQVAGTTLVVLAALVDKSLVRRVGTERYDLHEVVRLYAANHLESDTQEYTVTQDQHAAYFAALLADRERALTSPSQRATVAELAVELDNMRAAWRWAGQRRRFADLRKALRSLHHFFEIRGSYEEAVDLFRQGAEALGSTGEIGTSLNGDERLLHGDLMAEQAWFAFRYGQFEQASGLMHRGLALLGPQTAEAALSAVLAYLWMLRPGRGDYAEGQQLLRQRVALLRAQGDQLEVAVSLLHLGLVAQFQDDHREGYRLMGEALTLARSLRDPLATARILGFASGAATAFGAYEDGRKLAEECIAINRETSDHFSIGVALLTLGRVAHAQGHYAEARSRYEASLAIFQELGDRWNRARALSKLGHTLHALGESGDAYRSFLAALETLSEVGALARELDAVLGLVVLLRDRGKAEQSAELCLHVLHRVAGSSEVKDQAQQLWSELLSGLSEQQIAAITERVRARPLEAAVAELLRTSRK